MLSVCVSEIHMVIWTKPDDTVFLQKYCWLVYVIDLIYRRLKNCTCDPAYDQLFNKIVSNNHTLFCMQTLLPSSAIAFVIFFFVFLMLSILSKLSWHFRTLMKEDSAGLDMWYEWITSAYLDRRCTGRFRGLREVQVVRVQTGGAQSTRTC